MDNESPKRMRANRRLAIACVFLLSYHLAPIDSHTIMKRCCPLKKAAAANVMKNVMGTAGAASSSAFNTISKNSECQKVMSPHPGFSGSPMPSGPKMPYGPEMPYGPTTPPAATTTPAPTTTAPASMPTPTTVAPTTMAPTTMAPTTMAPTTVAPTTMAPTTVGPTTVTPTTMAPTTVGPTTVTPTTVTPTTVGPTTVTPTTVVPTTVGPTTVTPTTAAPTTTSSSGTVSPCGGRGSPEEITIDIKFDQEGSMSNSGSTMSPSGNEEITIHIEIDEEGKAGGSSTSGSSTQGEVDIHIEIDENGRPVKTADKRQPAYGGNGEIDIHVDIEGQGPSTAPSTIPASTTTLAPTTGPSTSPSIAPASTHSTAEGEVEIKIDVEEQGKVSKTSPETLRENISIMVSVADKLSEANTMLKESEFDVAKIAVMLAEAGKLHKTISYDFIEMIDIGKEFEAIEGSLGEFIELEASGLLMNEELAVEAISEHGPKIIEFCESHSHFEHQFGTELMKRK